jgi:hypothetical protein
VQTGFQLRAAVPESLARLTEPQRERTMFDDFTQTERNESDAAILTLSRRLCPALRQDYAFLAASD